MDLQNNKTKIGEGIIGGAVSLTIATIIVKLLGVLYKIPLANVLGDEGMGYFNSAYTVYSFFYLLCTAGVPKSVMILISEKLEKEELSAVRRILKVSLNTFFIIGVVISLGFVIFAVPLSNLIASRKSYVTMLCVAPSILFSSISGVLRGYLNSKMMLFEVAVSQVVEGAVKLAAGLCLALLAVRLALPVYIISAFTIIGVTLGSFISMAYLGIISKSKNDDENSEQNLKDVYKSSILPKIFKISLPITVSAALMSLSGIADLFLVMKRLSDIGYTVNEATSLYGNYTTLAVSMFNLAVSLITPISVAFMPMLTQSVSGGRDREFSLEVESALSLTAFITAPMVLGLSVFSEEILSLLFGSATAKTGAPLLVLLCPGIVFMSYILIINSSLEALSRPGLAMLSLTIGVTAKTIISGLLLGNGDFGISGAPIGTVISYAVTLFLSVLFLSHILGYNIPIIRLSFLPYLTAAISVLSSRIIYDSWIFGQGKVINMGLAIITSAILYIGLSSILGAFSRRDITKMAKFTKFG